MDTTKVKTGDILFFYEEKPSTIIRKIERIVTKSHFFHVAVAQWERDSNGKKELLLIEANSGGKRRIVPYDNVKHKYSNAVAVKSPVPFKKLQDSYYSKVGNEEYGYFDFIAIGIYELFGWRLGNFSGEVCSEMIASVLSEHIPFETTLVSPGTLYNHLVTSGCKATYI